MEKLKIPWRMKISIWILQRQCSYLHKPQNAEYQVSANLSAEIYFGVGRVEWVLGRSLSFTEKLSNKWTKGKTNTKVKTQDKTNQKPWDLCPLGACTNGGWQGNAGPSPLSYFSSDKSLPLTVQSQISRKMFLISLLLNRFSYYV